MRIQTLVLFIAFSVWAGAAGAQPAYVLAMSSSGATVGNSFGHVEVTLTLTCPEGSDESAVVRVGGATVDTSTLDRVETFVPLDGFARVYDVPCGGSTVIGAVALEEVAAISTRQLSGCVPTIYFGCLSPTSVDISVMPAAYMMSSNPPSVVGNGFASSRLFLFRTPELRLASAYTRGDVSLCGTSAPGINATMIGSFAAWTIRPGAVSAMTTEAYTASSCVTRTAVGTTTLDILPQQQSLKIRAGLNNQALKPQCLFQPTER